MSDARSVTAPGRSPLEVSIKVVGGGIGGLYAAYLLGLLGFKVQLLEASPGRVRGDASDPLNADESRAFGGRIESRPIADGLHAEFGPMRFEPHLQTRLRSLAFHLGLGFLPWSPTQAPAIRTSYVGMTARERRARDPLLLLYYGVLTMFFADQVPDDSDTDIEHRVAKLRHYMDETYFLEEAGGSWRARPDIAIEAGLNGLRRTARLSGAAAREEVGDPPLIHELGIWNALSMY